MKRNSIFVGFAKFLTFDMRACVLFPDNDSPETAHSIVGIAHQQAQTLGKNWREKISFEVPTTEVLRDGENAYTLVAFNQKSLDTFTKAIDEATANL